MNKNTNHIRVTIHKTKILTEQKFNSFALKLDFGNTSHMTENISGKEQTELGKSYFFELNYNSSKSNILELTAVSKTFFKIFESIVSNLI